MNQVDVYHGVAVADQYRWLEDDNAPKTQAGHGAGQPTMKLIEGCASVIHACVISAEEFRQNESYSRSVRLSFVDGQEVS